MPLPSDSGEPHRLVVGRIGRPHGVGGEVSVEIRTDRPDLRFVPGATLITAAEPLDVVSVRPHGDRLLVKFAQCLDRDHAGELRGRLLYVDVTADEALDAEDDAYYDHELIGLLAVTSSGSPLGAVTDVVHLPEQDLLAIATAAGEVMVPFVRAIVTDVNREAGRIVVDPPAGLLDL